MTSFDTDVLIIGGGPVGMTLACELARHGVRFRIVDKKTGPVTYSQAILVQVRTQEILDAMGIVSGWKRLGHPIEEVAVHAGDKHLGHVRLAGLDSPHDTPLVVGQNVTESLLLEQLTRVGATVERPVEATEIEVDDEGARVTIRHADGREERVAARYVVGCEGSRSLTRERLGIPFDGDRYDGEEFLQTDAKLSWTYPAGRGFVFRRDEALLLFFPMSADGDYRVIIAREDRDPTNREPPTLDEIESYVRRYVDPEATLSEPRWLNRFRCRHCKAARFRERSAFLAGDAGHVHVPVGGQGMNTGMQDAFNLAWKLAYVLKGWSPPSLLNTYDAERGPVAEELLKFTDTGFRFMTEAHPIRDLALRAIGGLVLRAEPAQERIRRKMGEFDIRYAAGPIVEDHLGSSSARAGDRAPDGLAVRRSDRATVSLFDTFRGVGFTALLFVARTDSDADVARILELSLEYASLGERLRFTIVAEDPARIPNDRAATTLVDRDRLLFEAYGVDSASIVVVRPDWYVGFRARLDRVADLKGYFSRLFI